MEWIKCSDRLPDLKPDNNNFIYMTSEPLLLFVDGGYCIGTFNDDGDEIPNRYYFFSEQMDDTVEPTYWAYLPEPPKQ